MQFTDIGFDDEGIISFHINGGEKVYYNPFLVALQAMIGQHVLDDYAVQTGSLVPRYVPIRYLYDKGIESVQKKAMEWLIKNCDKKFDAFYWRYEYAVEFGDETLAEGWISAYAQAYASLAFQLFYHVSSDEQYKEYCLGALSGMVAPLDKGGCMNALSDEMVWFEEIPGKNASHIFNAHIMALIALGEARDEFKTDKFDHFFVCGKRALTEFRDYFNTGTMSSYDVPRTFSLQLLIDIKPVAGADVAIGTISLEDGAKRHIVDLSRKDCFKEKESYASGVDWSSEFTKDKRRRIIIGRNVRSDDIPGGNIQNTYINFSSISTSARLCKLSIDYESNKEVTIVIKKNSVNGFVEINRNKRILLAPGNGKLEIWLRTSELLNDTSAVYHKYHIALLTEFNRIADLKWIDRYIDIFRRNIESPARDVQLKKLSRTIPTVESLIVEVNTKCDLRYKMGISGSEGGNQLDARLLIDRVKEAGECLKLVHFVGAEPTLYSGIGHLIAELKKLGKDVHVTTNGMNLKNTLKDMLLSGVDSIQINIDGPEKMHGSIREREELFSDILSLISEYRALIAEKKKGGFRMVARYAVTPNNYLSIENLIEPLMQAGFTDLWCTHMNYVTKEVVDCHNYMRPGFHIEHSTIPPECNPKTVNPWDMYCAIKKTREKAEEKGLRFAETPEISDYFGYEDLYHRPLTTVGAPVCDAPFRMIQINADGSICLMAECYCLDIGSIKNYSLKDAMFSVDMCDLRDRIIFEEQWPACKRCRGSMTNERL